MVQKEVLTLCESNEERERVESVYLVAERFKKIPVFQNLNDIESVKKQIKLLVSNYKARLESKEKTRLKKEQEKTEIQDLLHLVKQANDAGMSTKEVIVNLKKIVKDKYNESILQQIASLRGKLIE